MLKDLFFLFGDRLGNGGIGVEHSLRGLNFFLWFLLFGQAATHYIKQ
jgi:hypothetical protein